MKIYHIGDCVLLLDEVAAIESEHRSDANRVYVPVHLKGGQKIMACIHSKGENERAGQSDPYRGDFMKRFNEEIAAFRMTWELYVKSLA